MYSLLIIEDDQDLRETLQDYLQLKGHQITAVACLADAETVLNSLSIDLILLDLNLPDGDGLSLLHRLRSHCEIPLFVVSGRTDDASRLRALELRADDYILKPFNLRELALRIDNFFVRRSQPRTSSQVYPLGSWLFYSAGSYLVPSCAVSTPAPVIKLTTSEACCLICLLEAGGNLVSAADIIAALQHIHIPMSRESLPVILSRLRAKLQPVQPEGNLIEAVPRAGYRLHVAVCPQAFHATR
ncbi:response regulator transcription factor [Desulfuromonas thiophila]|uniref:response regulator transcription factor n=1 Tax=Desulfuromonas thiophila TaxID=57664 RepID=UPI0024A7D66A|nr:response regulator transcription factor [Desulfuromonas thiophila]